MRFCGVWENMVVCSHGARGTWKAERSLYERSVIEALPIAEPSDVRVMDCRNFVDKETWSTVPEPSGRDETFTGWSRRNGTAGSGNKRQEGLLLIEMEVVDRFCEGELGWTFEWIADMGVLVLTVVWREDETGGVGVAGWLDDGESGCGRMECSSERRVDSAEGVWSSSKVVMGVCGGEEGEGHIAVNRGRSSGRKGSQKA